MNYPVVIPVAGYGTRMLPATKSIPKELLPILNKSAIGYIAEEIKKSGLKNVILITGKNKDSIVDYFDRYKQLEKVLLKKGKDTESISEYCELNVASIRQQEALGTAHAISRVEHIVNGAFIVSLPDMIIENGQKYLKMMIEIYNKTHKGVIALMEVPDEKIHLYGIASIKDDGEYKYITDLIEKPKKEEAPSNLAIVGRYMLPENTFEEIKKTKIGVGQEFCLTDPLRTLAKRNELIGIIVEDEIHDIGNPLGYLKCNLYYGMKEYGEELKNYIKSVK